MAIKVVKSTCGLCYAGCGVLVHVESGKVTKIQGDPESPVNSGTLCTKGLASLEYLYHPDRLKIPLKRVRERGEGKWQEISWDEALSIIASELTKARDNYGAESVALIHGAAKGLGEPYLTRFANVFGTPNVASMGHVCFLPRKYGSMVTCGFSPIPDYDYPPACIIVWGSNKAKIGEYEQTFQALSKGARLIVIDPRETEFTRNADIWVQARPAGISATARIS